MADVAGTKDAAEKTEFAKRNPHLEKLVPDCIENAVDKLLPDALEKVLNQGVESAYNKYQNLRTGFEDGVGEVAGQMWRVIKHAMDRLNFGDLVFGVYQLALHHATMNDVDAVEGREVTEAAMIEHLIWATDCANAAYMPTRQELCKAAGIADSELLVFEPQTTPARPAYAVWLDSAHKTVVFGFRGTTDLNDMLTDACASCEPYCGGWAHWGMHEAASWFVEHELSKVVDIVKQQGAGWQLLLVGHSLGAGTAAMLAHMMRNEPAAKAVAGATKFSAVGVATPAVLTKQLAEDCTDYITSVVLMHDLVPRFSIHNVFSLKEEMDATDWGSILLNTAKDWAVPDVIENSETFKKLAAGTTKQAGALGRAAANGYLALQSAVVSGLHFAGLVKPNPGASKGAAAGAGEGMSAGDAATVQQAVETVGEKMANTKKEDVQKVYAPGRIFFIKRLDRHKGRAKFGKSEHRCKLCEDDSVVPPADHEHHEHAASPADESDAAAAADDSAGGAAGAAAAPAPPKPAYVLIEGAASQRFERIVLRETCLADHLTGGYVEGLRHALDKVRGKGA